MLGKACGRRRGVLEFVCRACVLGGDEPGSWRLPSEMGKRRNRWEDKLEGTQRNEEKGRNRWVVKPKDTQRNEEKRRNCWVDKLEVTQRKEKKERNRWAGGRERTQRNEEKGRNRWAIRLKDTQRNEVKEEFVGRKDQSTVDETEMKGTYEKDFVCFPSVYMGEYYQRWCRLGSANGENG